MCISKWNETQLIYPQAAPRCAKKRGARRRRRRQNKGEAERGSGNKVIVLMMMIYNQQQEEYRTLSLSLSLSSFWDSLEPSLRLCNCNVQRPRATWWHYELLLTCTDSPNRDDWHKSSRVASQIINIANPPTDRVHLRIADWWRKREREKQITPSDEAHDKSRWNEHNWIVWGLLRRYARDYDKQMTIVTCAPTWTDQLLEIYSRLQRYDHSK